jgi:hypothetical protein
MMAGLALLTPPTLNGNALFGFYYLFGSGPSSGPTSGGPSVSGGGPVGGIFGYGLGSLVASVGLNPGANPGSGSVLSGNIPGQVAASRGLVISGDGGLVLATSLSGGGANGDHNNGPVGLDTSVNPAAGQSATFSSGGNFAASYTGTYNGFANTLDFAPAASTAMPPAQPPTMPPAQTQPPTMGQLNDDGSGDTSGNGVQSTLTRRTTTSLIPARPLGPSRGGLRMGSQ